MEPNTTKWDRVKMGIVSVLAVGTLAGGAVAATYALWPEDSAEAKSGFCTSLKDFDTTVKSYQGLNPATATNEQMDQAYNDIEDAYNNVIDEGNEWVNAYDNPLTNWYWDMEYAIDALPDDNTTAENLADLESTIDDFPQAFADTFDKTGCTAV